MKRWVSIALGAMLSAGVASGALAQGKGPAAGGATGAELLKKSGCLACHQVDKKVIGPAHTDVANKYRGQKGAEDKLVASVQNGAVGTWGKIPMPPHKHIAEADIRTMVRYILTYK